MPDATLQIENNQPILNGEPTEMPSPFAYHAGAKNQFGFTLSQNITDTL